MTDRRLTVLAARIHDARLRSHLLAQAAFCRAHASRLLSRLSALGRGPLPVPPSEVEVPPQVWVALLEEGRAAGDAAVRYRAMADAARRQGDSSSAWICDLNHSEELDRMAELRRLAELWLEVSTADLPGAGAV